MSLRPKDGERVLIVLGVLTWLLILFSVLWMVADVFKNLALG